MKMLIDDRDVARIPSPVLTGIQVLRPQLCLESLAEVKKSFSLIPAEKENSSAILALLMQAATALLPTRSYTKALHDWQG